VRRVRGLLLRIMVSKTRQKSITFIMGDSWGLQRYGGLLGIMEDRGGSWEIMGNHGASCTTTQPLTTLIQETRTHMGSHSSSSSMNQLDH
jgi:hypothetical protein